MRRRRGKKKRRRKGTSTALVDKFGRTHHSRERNWQRVNGLNVSIDDVWRVIDSGKFDVKHSRGNNGEKRYNFEFILNGRHIVVVLNDDMDVIVTMWEVI